MITSGNPDKQTHDTLPDITITYFATENFNLHQTQLGTTH